MATNSTSHQRQPNCAATRSHHDIGESITVRDLGLHSELNGRRGKIIGPRDKSTGLYPVRLKRIDADRAAVTINLSSQNMRRRKTRKQTKSTTSGEKETQNEVPVAVAIAIDPKNPKDKAVKATAIPIVLDHIGSENNANMTQSVRYQGASAPLPEERSQTKASALPNKFESFQPHTDWTEGYQEHLEERFHQDLTEQADNRNDYSTPRSRIEVDDTSVSNNYAANGDNEYQRNTSDTGGDEARTPNDSKAGGRFGVGCCRGLMRDRHSCIAIFTALYITFGIMYASYFTSPAVCAYLCLTLTAFYVYYAFFKSNTFKYLFNMVTTETAMNELHQMYVAPPEIHWHIQCYHNEVWKTTWKTWNSSTNSYNTQTSTRVERVNTHSATGRLHYRGWRDVSTPLTQDTLEEHQLTKVLVKKYWLGDPGATAQKSHFITINKQDICFDLTETLVIPGYKKRSIAINDKSNRPILLHWIWYMMAHITIIYAYPYLMYVSAITDKVEVDIVKEIWTEDPGPQENAENSMDVPSYSRGQRGKTKLWRRFFLLRGFFSCFLLLIYTFGISVLALFIAVRATGEATVSKLHPNWCPVNYTFFCEGDDYHAAECIWENANCLMEEYPHCYISNTMLLEDDGCDEISECKAFGYIADLYCSTKSIANDIVGWFSINE
ncbi:hypothetical protein HJC23_000478 [Cyclotella cryptica]|uniref:Uncharacterized protein n=1 Tax=Cyclotella cryptica TaxID=29204 RepID=A0ABD3QAJ0_9STRA|eukprot:CCRYP_007240-RA/>CCRYP_007240-RA protein AED:0.06 eAED:0.06 QI:0/-1/0/1/-1/1/1/0/665